MPQAIVQDHVRCTRVLVIACYVALSMPADLAELQHWNRTSTLAAVQRRRRRRRSGSQAWAKRGCRRDGSQRHVTGG